MTQPRILPKLPVDLSSFDELRQQKYLYVDKTKYAYDLITGGRRFFLSRPRRFGKTLFVSTLREILLGSKKLFEGLWINSSDYEWKNHAVISLDLSTLGIEDADSLKNGLNEALIRVADHYEVTLKRTHEKPELILYDVVQALRKKFGHVALLIDEYDSPILHSLKNAKLALSLRDNIRNFFAAIKGLDKELDFVFITGVSSFTKAGIFSGMNNLQIVSLDENFSAVCGYTENELSQYFTDHIDTWAEKESVTNVELRKKIKEWYNGYRFSEKPETVYNPFSLMNALKIQKFKNFWFQSGTPTFLIDELKKEYRKREYRNIEMGNAEITEDALGSFDVGATPLRSLMFQTGYLTIKDYDRSNGHYRLDYPNFEVETALKQHILASLVNLDFAETGLLAVKLKSAFNEANIAEVVDIMKQLFMNIPYQLQVKKENYYHTAFHIACDVAGIMTKSETLISHGRIDLRLDLPNWRYIIEIKFNKSAEEALKQIEDMHYYTPFIKEGKPIILLGLNFQREPKSFDITYKEKKL